MPFKNIGTTEIIIIGLIVLLFFGGKKIPELMRGLNEAIREFRKGAAEEPESEDKK